MHAGAILNILLRVRDASNDLRIATEHVELSRKGPHKQSKRYV